MGDFQGHPFRGNQYEAGQRVKWSDTALQPARDRASNYIRKYGERPEHRAYDAKKAQVGTVIKRMHAEQDSPAIMRKKGDFIGYEVKFDGEAGTHQVGGHMLTPHVDAAATPGANVSRGDFKRSIKAGGDRPAPSKETGGILSFWNAKAGKVDYVDARDATPEQHALFAQQHGKTPSAPPSRKVSGSYGASRNASRPAPGSLPQSQEQKNAEAAAKNRRFNAAQRKATSATRKRDPWAPR